MLTSGICAVFLALVSAVSAAPARRAATATAPAAVYFINNSDENGVVSLKVNEDGSLSEGRVTSTRGAGAAAMTLSEMPAGPDALFSQGSIAIDDDFLFVVNAGSNTVSVLQIDSTDPTKLRVIGTPGDTLGDFPNSVAYSPKWRQVCAANTGENAGIACAPFDRRSGLGIFDKLRPFSLGQTTPPVGPANTVSHTFFNEDESFLYTTVKGDLNTDNKGVFSALAIDNYKVADTDVQSIPEGANVLFGAANIPGTSNVLVTDPSVGALITLVDEAGTASTVNEVAIDNQVATCWATYSDATGTAFLGDGGRNVIMEVDVSTGESVAAYIPDTDGPGFFDLRAAADFVYALFPGNATMDPFIQVLDVSAGAGKGKGVQSFALEGLDAGRPMGMVAYLG